VQSGQTRNIASVITGCLLARIELMDAKTQQRSLSGSFLLVGDWAWLWLIALAPLVVLLLPGHEFGIDWASHAWLTSYFGEFFRHHFSFPEVLNTNQLSGMPQPVFYGFLLYPILGVISAVTGAEIAIRLAVLAVLLLQSRQVFRLVLQVSNDRALSLVTTTVTCWSTYALTNLYNRGALNELFAVALLTSAVCAFARFVLLAPEQRNPAVLLNGFLFFVLAAGAHPITALFGGLFLALVVAVLFLVARERRRMMGWFALGVLGAALILSPWIYAVLKFNSSLTVSEKWAKIAYFTRSIDSVSSRLMPFPYDARTAGNAHVPRYMSPYLDAQITSGLLILALVLTARLCWKYHQGVRGNTRGIGIVAVCWMMFLLLFALSVTPSLGLAMPSIFKNLQFAYRLVSYLNLCLLVIIIGALAAIPASAEGFMPRGAKRWLLSGTLAVAMCGLVIKLNHAAGVVTTIAPATNESASDRALQLPDNFYGWEAYAITGGSAGNLSPDAAVLMKVGKQSAFGEVPPVTVQLTKAQNVLIHVQPFPWNQLLIDGQPIAIEKGRRLASGTIVALAAGTHEIAYSWRPAAAWCWLNACSRIGTILWLSFAFVMCIAPGISKRRRVAQALHLHDLETSNASAPQ
jgi:hypothetical protein